MNKYLGILDFKFLSVLKMYEGFSKVLQQKVLNSGQENSVLGVTCIQTLNIIVRKCNFNYSMAGNDMLNKELQTSTLIIVYVAYVNTLEEYCITSF